MSRLPAATRLLLGAIAAFTVALGGLIVAAAAGARLLERDPLAGRTWSGRP